MQLRAGTIRVGVVAAVVLVLLGAASATPWVVTLSLPDIDPDAEMPSPEPRVSGTPDAVLPPDQFPTIPLGSWVTPTLIVLAISIVAYLTYRVIRRLRNAWRPTDEPVPADRMAQGTVLAGVPVVDLEALVNAVQRAEAQLAGITEPGDAVVAAWVALEHEASLQGAARGPAQTSTEFTTDLLAATPAPPEAVVTLRGLYQRARFTRRPVSAADVDAARTALAAIAAAIDAAAPAEPTPEGRP